MPLQWCASKRIQQNRISGWSGSGQVEQVTFQSSQSRIIIAKHNGWAGACYIESISFCILLYGEEEEEFPRRTTTTTPLTLKRERESAVLFGWYQRKEWPESGKRSHSERVETLPVSGGGTIRSSAGQAGGRAAQVTWTICAHKSLKRRPTTATTTLSPWQSGWTQIHTHTARH